MADGRFLMLMGIWSSRRAWLIGLVVLLALGAAWLFWLWQPVEPVVLTVEIEHDSDRLTIRNETDVQWTDCDVTIGDGSQVTIGTIEAGQQVEVPFSSFQGLKPGQGLSASLDRTDLACTDPNDYRVVTQTRAEP